MNISSNIKSTKQKVESANIKLFNFIFDFNEWKIFIKRSFSLLVLSFFLFAIWMFPFSIIVSPFYSFTKSSVDTVDKYDIQGVTTSIAIRDGINDILDDGLVTNFIGVKTWIDNKYYQQVGQIETYRIALYALENNLGRNRGTGGANKFLTQARADLFSDYDLPAFTSFSKRMNQSISGINSYVSQLESDLHVPMINKKAVFIVNSDNLAETLDKMKQQLQTNLSIDTSFFTEDDKFYRIKGNLIALSNFLKGIDYDFKDKMIDKTSYSENFIPLLKAIDNAILQNHFVILEALGHVSKLEKEANIISQKLGELRDKLTKG
jgi:hypothetical protein